MKAVIFCGGQGTRLREETEYRPKPLVNVGERPILWHILKIYAHYGVRDFVLCLGYRGQMIKEYFLNYQAMTNDFSISLGSHHQISYLTGHKEQDFTVTLADTGRDTMTGGRLARVQKYMQDDTFMVTYGDGLSDVDITKLLEYHNSHGRIATLTTVRPNSRFGEVSLDENGCVRAFIEKPRLKSWVNAGFFVFNRRIFDYLTGDDCILEQAPLEKLAQEGELMAYRHDGFFYAMDTYQEYLQLNEAWNSGQAPWRVWT